MAYDKAISKKTAWEYNGKLYAHEDEARRSLARDNIISRINDFDHSVAKNNFDCATWIVNNALFLVTQLEPVLAAGVTIPLEQEEGAGK